MILGQAVLLGVGGPALPVEEREAIAVGAEPGHAIRAHGDGLDVVIRQAIVGAVLGVVCPDQRRLAHHRGVGGLGRRGGRGYLCCRGISHQFDGVNLVPGRTNHRLVNRDLDPDRHVVGVLYRNGEGIGTFHLSFGLPHIDVVILSFGVEQINEGDLVRGVGL